MAATARTLSGSRFLRPKLSCFFNQVAHARPEISRFVKTTAALMPPKPDMFSSRFLPKPATSPAEAVSTTRTASDSRFLSPKKLSRFIHQVAQAPPRIISRFVKGIAALMPLMPDIFASGFFSKPRTPPRRLRPHWPPDKPRDPGR
jgi:hypothetical protein